MKKLIHLFFLFPLLLSGQQLYIPSSAIIHISDGANLEIGGDLENNGVLQNNGTLSLYGNWIINNNYNGLNGRLQLLGGTNQMVSPAELTIRELIVNQGGEVNFIGDEYTILERLQLTSGIVKLGTNTRLILEPEVNVDPGSKISYVDGTLISEGSGIKTFPLGNNGVYGPITLLEVFGVDTEIAITYLRDNEAVPIPGDSLIGVSSKGYWEVEMLDGVTDPTKVEITFNEEDLSDFEIFNNIRHRVNSPVIGFSNDPGGIFEPLGIETLTSSDSVTFGTIVSENALSLTAGEKIYLAMALAPRIPEEGLFYIPEAFSPQASDPKNQAFKIFGEQISEEGFSLQIYNRYGSVVYSTDSFEEANRIGWNGESQKTGASEPAGVYYYTIKFQFETGLPIQRKGAFYLVK